MARRSWMALLALVVALLAVVLLFGEDLLGPGGLLGRGGGGLDPDPSGISESPAEASGAELAEGPQPILFGRPREERVGIGAVAGRVAALSSGAPVDGARLLLVGTGYGGEAIAVRATTAGGGAFRLAEVPAGEAYLLKVEAEALPPREVQGIAVRDGRVETLGTVWLGAQAVLRGRVVNEEGRGVAGAQVEVHPTAPTLLEMMADLGEVFARLDVQPEPLAAVLSGRDGSFVLEEVDPGPATLVVRAPGYRVEQRPLVAAAGAGTDETILVRVRRGAVVAGRVVVEEGRGLEGARVALMSSDSPTEFSFGRAFATTGRGGIFRFESAPPGGDLVLIAAAPGYPSSMRQTPPGVEDLEIVLRRGATLTVRVLHGPRDEPVEDARVTLAIGDEAGMRQEVPAALVSGRTDRVGRVTFDVPPGVIQMAMVGHPDHAAGMWMGAVSGMPGQMVGPEDPTVRPGRQEVVFRLGGGVVVVGHVKAVDGTPIAGAEVLSLGTLQMGRPALTAEDGSYRLVVPEAMAFVGLLARAEGYVQDPASLGFGVQPSEPERNADGEVVRDIVMLRAGVVTGRVVDQAGGPLAGARVRVGTTGQGAFDMLGMLRPVEGLTGRDGRYVVDGASPGKEIRVLARLEGYVDGASERFQVEGGGMVRAPDVVLETGATIVLTVTDPEGRALEGAHVQANVDASDPYQFDFMEGWQNEADVRTEAGGRARIEHLPKGTVTLVASHPEHAANGMRVAVPDARAAPIQATLALRRAVTVTGRVIGGEGQPVEAWVSAELIDLSEEVQVPPVASRAKADGTFRLERVPEGRLRLRANAEGHVESLRVLEGPGEALEIRLQRDTSDAARRRAEITQRMTSLSTRLSEARTKEERQQIAQEIQALNEELQVLMAESPAGDAVPVVSVPEQGEPEETVERPR